MQKTGITEFEAKLTRTSSLVKMKPGDKAPKCFWIGWYKQEGEEEYRVVLPTLSTTEQHARKKIEKYVEGVCLCGVGQLTSSGKINIDEPEVKKEIPLPAVVLKKISKNIMSNASFASQVNIRDFVVIDTETTGLYNKDDVVELAGWRFKDGKPGDTFHTYIIPKAKMAPQAEATHGLSVAFLRANGKPADEAYGQFKAWLKDDVVCGHNLKFDIRMVQNHSKRAKVPMTLKKGFCTLELSRKMMTLPNHKLANIIDWFDLRKGLDSHNAMDDVKATARYASILNRVYKHICIEAVST